MQGKPERAATMQDRNLACSQDSKEEGRNTVCPVLLYSWGKDRSRPPQKAHTLHEAMRSPTQQGPDRSVARHRRTGMGTFSYGTNPPDIREAS